MNVLSMVWQALHTRHLDSSDRAALLNPEIEELRQAQHEQLNRLTVLQARRQLRERRAQQEGEGES